jgi:hypothetical protein
LKGIEMNQQLIKYAIWCVIGAMCGAGVGMLIVNKIENDELDKAIQAENEAHGIYVQPEFDIDQAQKDMREDYAMEHGDDEPKAVTEKELHAKKNKKEDVDYTKYTRKNGNRKPLKDAAAEKLGEENVEMENTEGEVVAEIISLEDFHAGRGTKRSQETLTYYEEDDVLVAQDDSIIVDPETILAIDALCHFGEKNDDPDSVYIRNDQTMIDYEVVRLHKSYSEDVQGVKSPKKAQRKPPASRPRTQKVETIDEPEDEE